MKTPLFKLPAILTAFFLGYVSGSVFYEHENRGRVLCEYAARSYHEYKYSVINGCEYLVKGEWIKSEWVSDE